jgi:uncharacterized protein YndB with AHSA1/START domain
VIATNITNQYDGGRLRPRDPDAVTAWETVLDHLSTGLQAWLTVLSPDRTPIVRPVLAVLVDEKLHLASSPRSRKASGLEAGTTATLATRTDGIDLVWTGTPVRVTNADDLDRIAATYRERHGWDVVREGIALDAPYGAPCAGPPPYHVYRIEPETVHAFGTVEGLAERSTRFDLTPTPAPRGRTDRAHAVIAAPRDQIYAALLDRAALAAWLPPAGMTGRVLELDARPGGTFRMELTYLDDTPGKSGEHRDVTESTFVELEPDGRVIQRVHFHSDDPAFAGPMTMTWSLRDHPDGTLIEIRADDVPHGISADDHATGLASSLDNLARHVTGASEQAPDDGVASTP